MEKLKEKYKHIPGWGIDANPLNEPTYPMKDEGAEKADPSWQRPPKQKVDIEVLHSNERPDLPSVVGETLPPQYLSGTLRRYAFQYSESRYRHWLPLLLADRINEWEGIVEDVAKGRLPNLFSEKGWSARWKHQKKRLVRGALISAALGIAVYQLVKQR